MLRCVRVLGLIHGTRRTIISNGAAWTKELGAIGDTRFRRAVRKGLKVRHNIVLSNEELDEFTVTFFHRMNIADVAYHSLYYRDPSQAPETLVTKFAKGTKANSTVVSYVEPGQWDAEPTGRLNPDGSPEFRQCQESTGEIQTFAVIQLPNHKLHCNHVTCRDAPMVRRRGRRRGMAVQDTRTALPLLPRKPRGRGERSRGIHIQDRVCQYG